MSLIGRFEHLPNRPKSDEARPLLEKIASQVKPIMSKRSWKVGTLAEFLPANPALLGNNMNSGQKINLRLRPPGDVTTFYEYDQLVLVMLHELTHIEHGPHDAMFYKLLAELEEEYWDLKRKGYSGEGFHGAGAPLSGFKVPQHVGKVKGLEAAQKRLDVQRRIGKGGVLGGRAVAGRSVREVLAEAAERRMRDDKACNTANHGHAEEVEEEVRKAAEESIGVNASDLEVEKASLPLQTEGSNQARSPKEQPPLVSQGPSFKAPIVTSDPQISSPSNGHGTTIKSTSSPGSSSNNSTTRKVSPAPKQPRNGTGSRDQPYDLTSTNARPTKSLIPTSSSSPSNTKPYPIITSKKSSSTSETLITPEGEWQCPTCTLLNSRDRLSCEACTTARPSSVARMTSVDNGNGEGKVWFCDFCGAGPRDMGFWSCAECGWVRKWG